jgi:hypothetical protein
MMQEGRMKTARLLELVLFTFGALCLTLFGYHQAERIWFQTRNAGVAHEAPRLASVATGAPLEAREM